MAPAPPDLGFSAWDSPEPAPLETEPLEPAHFSDEPSAPSEDAVPIDLEEEELAPPAAESFSLAEMAQDTMAEPAQEPPAEPLDLPAVDIDEEGMVDEAPDLAPMHEFIPDRGEVGQPAYDLGDNQAEPLEMDVDELRSPSAGALDKRELERIARETIEKVVWEIVPQLAETILREEIEKLVADKLTE